MFTGTGNLLFRKIKERDVELNAAKMRLWNYLQQNPYGCTFRRDYPLSIYIVDFYCAKLKLVIEVENTKGFSKDVAAHHKLRLENLQTHGYKFLGFSSEDIEKRMVQVMDEIEQLSTDLKSASLPRVEDIG